MKLTQEERNFIARRAGGSYAIIPAVERIVQAHKKNRNPDDAVFLEFARLTMRKSYPWDEYERLQREILTIIPEPWGTPWWKKEKKEKEEPKAPVRTKRKRTVTCGICGDQGHNARSCPDKPDTPTVKHTDGVERLAPGFDPNPPSGVEEGKETT